MSRSLISAENILRDHTDEAVWELICMDNSIRQKKHSPAWEKYGSYITYANFICQAHNAILLAKSENNPDWSTETTIAIEGRDNKHFLHLGLVCLLMCSTNTIPAAKETHDALSELTMHLKKKPLPFSLGKYLSHCLKLITVITTNLTAIAATLPEAGEQSLEQQLITKACALALSSASLEIDKLRTESWVLKAAFTLSSDCRVKTNHLFRQIELLKEAYVHKLPDEERVITEAVSTDRARVASC